MTGCMGICMHARLCKNACRTAAWILWNKILNLIRNKILKMQDCARMFAALLHGFCGKIPPTPLSQADSVWPAAWAPTSGALHWLYKFHVASCTPLAMQIPCGKLQRLWPCSKLQNGSGWTPGRGRPVAQPPSAVQQQQQSSGKSKARARG